MRYIVDSNAMRLIEERSLRSGLMVETLMDTVAQQIADHICTLSPQAVLILAGRGNNGADAYSTGTILLSKKIPCLALQVSEPKENSLLKTRQKQFIHRGGKIVTYNDLSTLPLNSILLDGIYGAGFRGIPDAQATKAILFANAHSGIIISIDVPSGIDPSTGEASGEAIFADFTVACQYPKKGCFLKEGFEHCGKILFANLPINNQTTDLTLIEDTDLSSLLPRLQRGQDKFKAGLVVGIGGSSGMMGAVSLAAKAAFAVGAGYVRLLLPQSVCGELPELPLEAVKTLLPDDIEQWKSFLKIPGSIFLGPGLGRDSHVQDRLETLWPYCTAPTVVDADALEYLSKRPMNTWNVENKILTPHKKEASKLFQKPLDTIDDSVLNLLRRSALTTQSIIVLKGAPTYIACPQHPIIVMPFGNPGMATAGCGDVLTGMIAGLLAKGLPPLSAVILATSLHGIAGEEAAKSQTSYSITASSIIASIPAAIHKIMSLSASGIGRSYVAYGRSS